MTMTTPKPPEPATPLTVIRRVDLPVLKPITPSDVWDDFRKALVEGLDYCARAYNTTLAAIYLADIKQLAECAPGILPKIVWPNTYLMAVKACPLLPSGTVSSLDKLARDRYRGKNSDGMPYRVAAMRGRCGLPSMRYGSVFPIRAQEWVKQAYKDEEGNIFIGLPLLRPEKGVLEWWTVQLRTLDRHGNKRRQANIMDRILAGEIDAGELVVYRKGKNKTVMVGVSAYVPVDCTVGNRSAVVKTGRTFFTVHIDGDDKDKLWFYHNDGFRRRAFAHRSRLERQRHDYKFEPRKWRENVRTGMANAASKHNRRLDNMLHNASSWLINFCARQGVVTLVYDETDKSFGEVLPWSRLRQMVADKAEQRGIDVTFVGYEEVEDD